MSKSQSLTESEVRALRDAVFGKPSTDKNWEGSREHWMLPAETAWLVRTLRDTRCQPASACPDV